MPVHLNAEEQVGALEKGSSDLKFLFAREQVSEELQAKLYSVGITTVAKFATVASDEADLKALLAAEFELDSATSLAARVKVASVVVAYKSAQGRTQKSAAVEGEMDSKLLTKPLQMSEFTSMKAAWELKWWPLDDSQTPSRVYIEARCAEVETGDLRAEMLTAVISREEDAVEGFQSYWDSSGNLQLRRSGNSVAEPVNPEQLRMRLKLLGVAQMMIGLRHSNRPNLQGTTPQDIENYLTFLLGEHVWGLTGKSADGGTVATPSWAQLIIYEYAIRRKAHADMLASGISFRDALKSAYSCPITKERYFTMPVALSSVNKRPLAFNDGGAWEKRSRNAKGGGKGGGKKGKGGKGEKGSDKGKAGGGKGASKGNKPGLCYAYNNSWERCRAKNCRFAHECSKCGGKHPMYNCRNSDAPATSETQGAQQ